MRVLLLAVLGERRACQRAFIWLNHRAELSSDGCALPVIALR
jgi:hypothetical protein